MEPPHQPPRVRFTTEISLGNLLSIGTILLSFAGMVASYSADQARRDATASQLRLDVDQNRKDVKDSLARVEQNTEELRRGLASVQLDIAVMKAQQHAEGTKK